MKQAVALWICLFSFWGLYGQERNNAFALEGVRWQNTKIPVSWENPSPANEQERKWVETAIAETWQKNSSVIFTGWGQATPEAKGIRIKIEDSSSGPHTEGLGKQLDGKKNGMTLNFTFNNWSPMMKQRRKDYIVAIAVHEFGHALGLAHEHNRKDCIFCDKEKQGTDGDVYVTTCDSSSVMNYCNPNYNNWGKLSAGDKKAIRILYASATTNNAPTVANNQIDIAHTARDLSLTEKKVWKDVSKFLKVYVQASPEEMALIKEVTYYLHPSFPDPVMTIQDPSTNYGIGLFVWGQFELTALIRFKDGSEKTIQHQLDFEINGVAANRKTEFTPTLNNNRGVIGESEGGQRKLTLDGSFQAENTPVPSEPDVFVIHEYSAIDGNFDKHQVKLTIQSDETTLNNIDHVNYVLPPGFPKTNYSSTDRGQNFFIQFPCDNSLRVKTTIYFKDGKKKEIDYEVSY